MYKFELIANNKYQIIFKIIVNFSVLFLQILSDNFQKINHPKNIQSAKIDNVNQI